MIIELVLNHLYNLFNILTQPISIPQLPDNIATNLDNIMEYLKSGASILAMYVPLQYLLLLFSILLSIDIGVAVYHFVMWVIKKIPMLGVS